MTPKCKGILGLLFGHKLNDIYDGESFMPSNANLNLTLAIYPELILKEMRHEKETYVQTICERCGQVEKRLL